MVEHPLPPSLQGKAIADGPLPFLFGAEAEKLRQRYYLHLITPGDVKGEIWLEAYPKFQKDAANFQKSELILKADGMVPAAMQIYEPSGKQRTVYKFDDVVINDRFWFLDPNPIPPASTPPSTPLGWTRVVDQPPPPRAQANRYQPGVR